MGNLIGPLILIAFGAFTLGAAVFEWEWYWRSRKAQMWQSIAGPEGARIIHGVLGLAMIAGRLLFAPASSPYPAVGSPIYQVASIATT